jgi:hypothetical protein
VISNHRKPGVAVDGVVSLDLEESLTGKRAISLKRWRRPYDDAPVARLVNERNGMVDGDFVL